MILYFNEASGKYLTEDKIDRASGVVTRIETINIQYLYHIDQEAKYEEFVIREYPETGGQDVGYKEVSPAIGHWEMINRDTQQLLNYPIMADTSGFSKETGVNDILEIMYWHTYTEEELLEREKEAEEAMEQQKAIESLPSRVDDVEETQDDIVLLLADIVGGAV